MARYDIPSAEAARPMPLDLDSDQWRKLQYLLSLSQGPSPERMDDARELMRRQFRMLENQTLEDQRGGPEFNIFDILNSKRQQQTQMDAISRRLMQLLGAPR